MNPQCSRNPNISDSAIGQPLCCLVLGLCLAFPAGVSAEPIVPPERLQDVQQVQQLASTWIDAYQSGDIDTLMGLYTPDAIIYIGGKQALRGLAEIRRYFEPRLGEYEFDVTLQREEYLFHGDLIIDVGLVWINGRNRSTGETFEDAVRSLVIFRRTDSAGWKIYRDMDQHTQDTEIAE